MRPLLPPPTPSSPLLCILSPPRLLPLKHNAAAGLSTTAISGLLLWYSGLALSVRPCLSLTYYCRFD